MEAWATQGTKRLVPWKTSEEWRNVYMNVYSKDFEKKRWACDLLKSWSCRFANDLSMGLRLTLFITEAQLLDQQNQKLPKPFLSDFQVAIQYSYAITRFVNDLLESIQDKKFLVPLTRLAKKVKMPVRLVELRHECTHGEMATVQELRCAAVKALMYLKKNYWETQIFHYNAVCRDGTLMKETEITRESMKNFENEEDEEKEEEAEEEEEEEEDADEGLNEEWVDEEDFKDEFKHYIQECMKKLLRDYCRAMADLSKKEKLIRPVKVLLNTMERFLQADSKQTLWCICTNEAFIAAIKSPDSLPADWHHLVGLLLRCDLVADTLKTLLLSLGDGGDMADNSDDDINEACAYDVGTHGSVGGGVGCDVGGAVGSGVVGGGGVVVGGGGGGAVGSGVVVGGGGTVNEDLEQVQLEEEDRERVMMWCIALVKEANKSDFQSSLLEKSRSLLVEVLCSPNDHSLQLIDLIVPHCLPPLKHHETLQLREFASKLHALKKSVDADARAGMLKSLAEDVAQQCKGEEEEEEDDDEQDGLRSKKPKITLLMGEPRQLPRGIKTSLFYDTLPRIRLFKKRKRRLL